MPLLETLVDNRVGNGLGELSYRDFSAGLNDTQAPMTLSDRELAIAENVDFSTQYKAFSSRKGVVKANTYSFNGNVTDGYSWTVGQKYKKCVVVNNALYDLNVDTGESIYKGNIAGPMIYPWVMFNRLYFGDGKNLYVWGDYDNTTELKETINLTYDATSKRGTIVRYYGGGTGKGDSGHFYMSKTARTNIALANEDYTNKTNWQEVTEVVGLASNVVRPLKPSNSGAKETFVMEILSGINATGTIAVMLDNYAYQIVFSSLTESVGGSVVTTVQGALNKIVSVLNAYKDASSKLVFGATGLYTISVSGNIITITANQVGMKADAFFDSGQNANWGALIEVSWRTTVQGKADTNNIDPIKKCTMFWLHQGSQRVFAAGNPDDNALYYSAVGDCTIWNSDIDKVYPSNGFGRITAISELTSYLLVSYQNGWYSWSGIDAIVDAKWQELGITQGCVCHRSVALTPFSFTFLSREGVINVQASILQTSYALVTGRTLIKSISENQVENSLRSIKDYEKCRAVFYDNAYYLAYNIDGETPECDRCDDCISMTGLKNTRVLKYEYQIKAWSVITGWTVNQFMADANNLYFCSENYALKALTGYSDIDTETGEKKPIDVRVRTKDYDFYSPFKWKKIEFVGLVFKQEAFPPDSFIDIGVRFGYKETVVKNLDLTESLSWGKTWGRIWGWRDETVAVIEVSEVSDMFSLEFRYSILDVPATLLAIGWAYRTVRQMNPQSLTQLKDERGLKPTYPVTWR